MCLHCCLLQALWDVILSSFILGCVWGVSAIFTTWYTRRIADSLHLRREIMHNIYLWIFVMVCVSLFQFIPVLNDLQDGGFVLPGMFHLN